MCLLCCVDSRIPVLGRFSKPARGVGVRLMRSWTSCRCRSYAVHTHRCKLRHFVQEWFRAKGGWHSKIDMKRSHVWFFLLRRGVFPTVTRGAGTGIDHLTVPVRCLELILPGPALGWVLSYRSQARSYDLGVSKYAVGSTRHASGARSSSKN